MATYDLKPEMSARQVTEALVKKFVEEDIGLVIANYANADMVGHTGNFEASVKACEVIDECLGKVVDAAMGKKGHVVITADHGNIEQLIDYDTGMPHTAHTTNLVPLILVDEERKNRRLTQGAGSDVAPTVLKLLELPQPKEMTGRSLIVDLNPRTPSTDLIACAFSKASPSGARLTIEFEQLEFIQQLI